MGLLSIEAEVTLQGKNIKYYEELGYEIPRKRNKRGSLTIPRGTTIFVKLSDLQINSKAKVSVKCDGCNKSSMLCWSDYTSRKNENYYCLQCSRNGGGKYISISE